GALSKLGGGAGSATGLLAFVSIRAYGDSGIRCASDGSSPEISACVGGMSFPVLLSSSLPSYLPSRQDHRIVSETVASPSATIPLRNSWFRVKRLLILLGAILILLFSTWIGLHFFIQSDLFRDWL